MNTDTPYRTLAVASLILLTTLANGCARRTAVTAADGPAQPPPKPLGPPLFDGRRGGGAFPFLGDAFPQALPDLTPGMEAAYAQRLIAPDPDLHAVDIRDNTLRISVSGWRVRSEYEPVQFDRKLDAEQTWHASRVEYLADPLEYETGAISVRLVADDAELHGLRDRRQTGIVLAGAHRGELHFSAQRDDLTRVFTAGARRGAGRAGVRVQDLSLTLEAPNPRTVSAQLTMTGSWLLLPMRLYISGNLVVDDDLHAHFDQFTVRGEGPAGEFLQPFIARALKRLEERRSPLMAFRDEQTLATDFTATSGERFEVTIPFARQPKTHQPPTTAPAATTYTPKNTPRNPARTNPRR